MSEQLNPGQNPEWERPEEKQDFKKDEINAFKNIKGPEENAPKETAKEFEKINEIPVNQEKEMYETKVTPFKEPDDNQKEDEKSDQSN